MTTLNVSADILIRIIGAASTEATRYYLNGVHVRTRARTPGVVLEAIDGHMLAIEIDEIGNATANAIVGTEAIAEIARVAKVKAKQHKCEIAKFRVIVEEKLFRIFIKESDATEHTFTSGGAFVDGTFPECERVIPCPPKDGVPIFHGGLNPALLLQLVRTSKTLDRKTSAFPCTLYQNGEGDPTLVRVAGAPNWLGVIMPLRAKVAGPRPAWFEASAYPPPVSKAAE